MIEYIKQKLLERVQKEVDALEVDGLKGKISDGYHTFDELYEHRIALYMELCRKISQDWTKDNNVWMTKVHSDGSIWDGWFLLGVGHESGKQITYHLPLSQWDECEQFAMIIDKAPEWDGHTSQDVLKRLKQL